MQAVRRWCEFCSDLYSKGRARLAQFDLAAAADQGTLQPMITKWSLENFKSVGEPVSLDFKPLTIFAGANSSGKSSVLQSILLISQTLASNIATRSVVLNGHLVKLGQ